MRALVEELNPADLHRMLGSLLRHVDELSRSAFPRLRLEMALLEICQQGPTVPIADLLSAVENARSSTSTVAKKKTEQTDPLTESSVALGVSVPMEAPSHREVQRVANQETPTSPSDDPLPISSTETRAASIQNAEPQIKADVVPQKEREPLADKPESPS